MTDRAEKPTSAILNLANVITITRVILVPVFVWALLMDAGRDGGLRWLAVVVFVLAMASDAVDGYVARSMGLITDFGKILDPIADKLLTGAALVCFCILGELWWWVAILILVREVGITGWRIVQLRRGRVVPASSGGKLKTVAQAIAIILFLVPFDRSLGGWMLWVDWAAMAVATVLTMWSGATYLITAAHLSRALSSRTRS